MLNIMGKNSQCDYAPGICTKLEEEEEEEEEGEEEEEVE